LLILQSQNPVVALTSLSQTNRLSSKLDGAIGTAWQLAIYPWCTWPSDYMHVAARPRTLGLVFILPVAVYPRASGHISITADEFA
jgi:hypothetical protein